MEKNAAAADLDFIASIIQRTQRRIDPHAFHYVLWGVLVLVCYPLLNWFQNAGNVPAMGWVGGSALLVGALGSTLTELRLARRPRLAGENTFVSKQVALITWANVGPGILLSAVGPASAIQSARPRAAPSIGTVPWARATRSARISA